MLYHIPPISGRAFLDPLPQKRMHPAGRALDALAAMLDPGDTGSVGTVGYHSERMHPIEVS